MIDYRLWPSCIMDFIGNEICAHHAFRSSTIGDLAPHRLARSSVGSLFRSPCFAIVDLFVPAFEFQFIPAVHYIYRRALNKKKRWDSVEAGLPASYYSLYVKRGDHPRQMSKRPRLSNGVLDIAPPLFDDTYFCGSSPTAFSAHTFGHPER